MHKNTEHVNESLTVEVVDDEVTVEDIVDLPTRKRKYGYCYRFNVKIMKYKLD